MTRSRRCARALRRRDARHPGAARRTGYGLRPQRRRLGLGPIERRRLCRLASRPRTREAAAQRRRTRSPRLRTFAFPGPSIKLPPAETLSLGARLTSCAMTAPLPCTRRAVHPAGHIAPLDAYGRRFRRGCRNVRRNALSMGRQDQPRHRLLRPGAGRAQRMLASAARATATCRSKPGPQAYLGGDRNSCGAAI